MRFLLFASMLVLAGCPTPYGPIDVGNPGYGGGIVAQNAVLIDPHTENVYAVKSVPGAAEAQTTTPRPVIEHGCDAAVLDVPATDTDASVAFDGIGPIDIPDSGPRHQELWRINPDAPGAQRVMEFSNEEFASVSFPGSRILYDVGSHERVELRLQDPATLDVLARQPIDLAFTQFADTLAPSENYLLSNGYGPVIGMDGSLRFNGMAMLLADTRTLETHVTTCAGASIQWLHTGDRFLALWNQSLGDGGYSNRLRVYAVDALVRNAFATDSNGRWTGGSLDVDTRLTSMAVSPDDRFVAGAAFGGGIEIVDLTSGSSQHVDGISGPVVFSPSGAMLIGWRDRPGPDAAPGSDGGHSSIVMYAMASGMITTIDTGFADFPIFFIASDGHHILLIPYGNVGQTQLVDGGWTAHNEHLAIADLDMHMATASTVFDRPTPSIGTIVNRAGHGEVWFLHPGTDRFDRLDLATGAYDIMHLGFNAEGVGYLPRHDWFVFSEESTPPAVRFWAPATTTTVQRVFY